MSDIEASDILVIARRQLGLPQNSPPSRIPTPYVEELRKHLSLYPQEDEFRVILDAPYGGLGTAVCSKNGCGAAVPLIRRVSARDGGLSDGLGSLSAYREHIRGFHSATRVARAPLTPVKNEATMSTRIPQPEQENAFLIKKEPIETKMPTRKRLSDVAFHEMNSGEPLGASGPSAAGPSKRYKTALDEVTNSPTIKREIKPEPDAMFPYLDLQQRLNDVRAAIDDQGRLLDALLDGGSRGGVADVDAINRTFDELTRLRQLESSYLRGDASGNIVKPEAVSGHLSYPTPVKTEYYASGSSTLASSSPVRDYSYNAAASGSGIKHDYSESDMDQDMAEDHSMEHEQFNPFAAGIAPPAPIDDDAYDSNGDYHGRDRDLFEGPQALPDDITTFLVEAGNAESFVGNENVHDALHQLGLNSLFDKLPGMEVSLMPHQVMGVAWMLGKEAGKLQGGCLADEMGLGKTVQMIATIVKNRSTDPACKTTLVLAPVALLDQWKFEIEEKTNCELTCLIYHGQTKLKKKSDLLKYDIVLASHGTMAREWPDYEMEMKKKAKAKRKKDAFIVSDSDDADMIYASYRNKKRSQQAGLLFQVDFYRIVVDEGQTIRNRKTRVARAITDLRATYRWILTGTPIVNSLTDVYSYLRFLKIRPWYDWTKFNFDIAKLEKKKPQLAASRLQKVMLTFLLRRKKDTKLDGKPLIDLPPKEIVMTRLEFTEEEREIYSMVEAKTQAKFNRFLQEGTVLKNYHQVLVLLLRLRQVCSHASLIQEDCSAFTHVDDMDLKPELAKEVTRARRIVSSDFVDRMKAKFKQTALYRMEAEKNSEDATIEEEECPICYDVMTDAVFTSCGHMFCRDCILDVINRAPAGGDELAEPQANVPAHRPCPVCRADINAEKVFRRAAFEPSEKDLRGEARDDEEDDAMDIVDSDEEDEYPATRSKGKGKGKERARPRRRVAVDSDEEDDEMNESDDDFIVQSDEDEEEKDARRALRMRGRKARPIVILDSDDEPDTPEEKAVMFGVRSKKAADADGPIPTMSRFLPSTKMKFMMEHIEKLAETNPDEKILIVSQWTSCLSLVSDYLEEKGIPHVKYQGDMNRNKRDQAVRVFMSKEKARIMLMSLKCGGVGLNLTRANNVISLDLAWSMAVEAQAYDRVHRLGQTRNVVVQRVVIADTVEDRILQRQERKQMLADGSLGEGNGQKLGKLTVKELANLFGLDIRGNRI